MENEEFGESLLRSEGELERGAGLFEESVRLAVGHVVRAPIVHGRDEVAFSDALLRRLASRIHLFINQCGYSHYTLVRPHPAE